MIVFGSAQLFRGQLLMISRLAIHVSIIFKHLAYFLEESDIHGLGRGHQVCSYKPSSSAPPLDVVWSALEVIMEVVGEVLTR